MRLIFSIGLTLIIFDGYAQMTVPTPTCNATAVNIRFDFENPAPTYFPGQSFSLQVRPVEGSDWPTTPTEFGWGSDIFPMRWTASNAQTYLIPNPAPDTIYFDVMAFGNGIRPSCERWMSNGINITARRFDYIPTPSLTPTASYTPYPTFTSWIDPCKLMPTPTLTCHDTLVYPPGDSVDIPTSFVMELRGEAIFSLEDLLHDEVIPTLPLGDKRFFVTGLRPGTLYTCFNLAYYDACGEAHGCFPSFKTDPNAPQYPTISPTPYPTRTPNDSPTPTPPSPTASPTASPSPSSTSSPAPTAITPSPSAIPLRLSGWMLGAVAP